MKRNVLAALTWLSLPLCATTCTLWALSNVRVDTAGWAGWRDEAAGVWHGWGVHSRPGQLSVYYFVSRSIRFDDPTSIGGNGSPAMRPHAFHHHVGGDHPPGTSRFRFDHLAVPSIDVYVAAAPHGLLAAVLAVAPAWVGWRGWGRYRRRRGRAGRAFDVVRRDRAAGA